MRRILTDCEIKDPKTCYYGFPWRSDSICFNFRMPDEFVFSDELLRLSDEELEQIETLVIGSAFEDNSFISKMKNLSQLYIYGGGKTYDLDFLKDLLLLNQIYIADSHISSFDGLKTLLGKKKTVLEEMREADKDEYEKRWLNYFMDGVCIVTDSLEADESAFAGLKNKYSGELIINGKLIK